jgi:UDP-glucuronate decarboxylase
MRILVTGGAGFLGSHLCDRLLADGHDVVAIDNLFTGRKLNIEHLFKHPRFEFVRHDIIDPFKFEVDQIYNLACPASPPHYQYNPIKTIKTSVMGAINCLGLAKRTRARVFQASTSEVYGDPHVHPQPETYWGNVNPIGRRSCYDEGKRCAETLFFDYHREHNLDIRVIRIFNTYGPRMHEADGRVVSNFIVQALRGDDITIYGDGSQTRSFCYVDDLIEGFVRFMTQTETVGPVNLGNPGEFTMLELAELTLKIEDRAYAAALRRPQATSTRHHAREKTSGRLGAESTAGGRFEADDRIFQNASVIPSQVSSAVWYLGTGG